MGFQHILQKFTTILLSDLFCWNKCKETVIREEFIRTPVSPSLENNIRFLAFDFLNRKENKNKTKSK